MRSISASPPGPTPQGDPHRLPIITTHETRGADLIGSPFPPAAPSCPTMAGGGAGMFFGGVHRSANANPRAAFRGHAASIDANRLAVAVRPNWRSNQSMGRYDVRFTPETGHAITDVRLLPDFVRFTPESGHSRQVRQCPLIAKTGHSAKANKALAAGPLRARISTLVNRGRCLCRSRRFGCPHLRL